MPEVVGEVAVRVRGDARGVASDIERSIGVGALERAGSRVGQVFSTALKRVAQVSFAAVGAIVTTALVKGFQRLRAIDDARGKLLGLGHDARTVEGIMADALASVEGTSFGLGSAATIAASAVAAGIRPGAELQRTLKLVADTSTIAGDSMENVGAIFMKVAAQGRLQGDELMQLSERGIPALQFLADELGVTTTQVLKMQRRGEISFEIFQRAMERGLGGAAQAGGRTFSGAMANVGAALSRAGAAVLQSAFNQMPDIFANIIQWVNALTQQARPMGDALGGALRGAFAALQAFISSDAGRQFFVDLLQMGRDVAAIFMRGVVPAFRAMFDVVSSGGGTGFSVLRDTLSFLANNAGLVTTGIYGLVGAMVALKVAQMALVGIRIASSFAEAYTAAGSLAGAISNLTGITQVWNSLQSISAAISAALRGSTLATAIGYYALAAAQKIAAAAQWLMNTAWLGFPLVWIIAAIVAVIAAIVLLWRNSETFRRIVTGAWNAVKVAIGAVVTFITGTVWPAIQAAWAAIGAAAVWLGNTARSIWSAIASGFMGMARAIIGFFNTWIRPVLQLYGAMVVFLWVSVVRPVLNAIMLLWRSMANLMRNFWTAVISVVFAQVRAGFTLVGNIMRIVYSGTIQPVIGWFRARLIDLRNVFNVVRAWIIAAWNAIANGIRNGWTAHISPVLAALRTAISRTQEGFANARDGIARAWAGIQDAVKKPVRFVLETVLQNGIISKFNVLARAFGTPTLPSVWPVAGFREGGPTGNRPRRSIAGVVHGQEHVVTAEEVARTPGGHGTWERLRALARRHLLPGFWLGGGVQPVPYPARQHPRARYPWARWAGDFPAPMGTPIRAYKAGQISAVKAWNYSYGHHVRMNHGAEQTLYAHMSRLAASVGARVAQAAVIGYVGSTGNSTGPHLHFELKGGTGALDTSGSAGPQTGIVARVINWTKRLADALSGPLDRLRELGSGTMPELLKGMVRRVVDEMKKKIFGERAEGEGADTAGPVSTRGAAQRTALAMLSRFGWGSSQFSPLQKLWERESNWNPRAQNRMSGAYGIPQALPGSKMASAGSDWRTNAATQIAWGLRYIKDRYGTPSAAWAHSNRFNWYDQGGWLQPGLSLAVNNTRRRERVLDPDESRAWELAQQRPPANIYVTLPTGDPEAAAMAMMNRLVRSVAA